MSAKIAGKNEPFFVNSAHGPFRLLHFHQSTPLF